MHSAPRPRGGARCYTWCIVGLFYRHGATLAAGALSILMIAGAFALAKGGLKPVSVEASTETALLAAVAAKDSDGDGLPDWEEALYGTDPYTYDTKGLGMSDGEAVARGLIVPKAATPAAAVVAAPNTGVTGLPTPHEGSLTDAFAKNFFTRYVEAKAAVGGDLSSDQIANLATDVIASLTASIAPAPDFLSAAKENVGAGGEDALRTYAATAEAVFAAHMQHLPENELDALQAALAGDSSKRAVLELIAAAYRDGATGLAALSVPPEVAAAHLALVNGLARAGGAVADFARVGEDPIAAMLALEQYPRAIAAAGAALQNIALAYEKAGVSIPAGSPGAYFVSAGGRLSGRP